MDMSCCERLVVPFTCRSVGIPWARSKGSWGWRQNPHSDVLPHQFYLSPNSIRSCIRISCSRLTQLTASEPSPQLTHVEAFAPATVANLGPGFDFLGCAVDGLGDYVSAQICERTPPGNISISSILGDGGKLSLQADKNCVGIAGKATLELLGVTSVGVSLSLRKGLPLGSGLGSSAASAAAAAVAINALFGSPLSKDQLVLAGLVSEASVSGYHADNIAPSILGGSYKFI